MRRLLRGIIGPGAIQTLVWYVGRRSWSQTQALGQFIGRLGFRIDRRHRQKAEENLRLAFGDEVTPEWIHTTAQACFEHLATFFLEALRLASMTPTELAGVCEIVGLEHAEAALKEGRGAVLFSGHIGNWEVGAVRLLQAGLPVVPLSRSARNPRLARAIAKVRERIDMPVIPVAEGVRGIMRALKENRIVPIMPDRFARGHGLTVPFFGRPTHVWQTPALMAQRTGCAVLPGYAVRLPDGRFEMRIEPPMDLQVSGDREQDLLVNTTRLMARLEAWLRETPEQYTWPYHLWRPGFELSPQQFPTPPV